MKNSDEYTIGKVVSYKNGNPSILTGTIKKVVPQSRGLNFLIIDEKNKALVALYEAGCAVGDFIHESQIIKDINNPHNH